MNVTGRCLCSRVRYVAQDVETDIHSCHCGMCRRWSGGPVFAAGVASVSFEGEENLTRYASSDWAERGFCKNCGTNLFYHLKQPDHYVMWISTMDDLAPFKLTGEIYIDDKPDFYDLAGDHPRLTGEEFLATFKA